MFLVSSPSLRYSVGSTRVIASYLLFFFLPQVHFVPDAGTVAQIVYTDDQVRPPQQVVYTADGASYASVDGPQHTLVYIHPVEAAQARWDRG